MANVSVTIIRAGRSDDYGRAMEVGSTQSLPFCAAKSLWQAGFASVTDSSVFDDDYLAQNIEQLVLDAQHVLDRPIRRQMYPVNLINPGGSTSVLQTLGTSTIAGSHPAPRTYSIVATSSGSTARITAGPSPITLDTTKMYELSATVIAYSVSNQGAMVRTWIENSSGVSAGTASISMASRIPVPGTRYGIRFTPTSASNTFRFGFGANAGENVVTGDYITFSDMQLCEVDSLTGTVIDFSYAPYGRAGKSPAVTDTIGSCIVVVGDSWMNDTTDPGQLLGTSYGREVILAATGGYRLDQIATALDAKIASGKTSLCRPNFNIPGIAVIQGGINDVTADASGATMLTRLQGMLDVVAAKNIVPIVVLPVLASDSNYYTAARATAISDYCNGVYAKGCNVVNPGDFCLNSDGTANTTYMLSEALNWIHLTTPGYAKLASLIDAEIRRVEQAMSLAIAAATW